MATTVYKKKEKIPVTGYRTSQTENDKIYTQRQQQYGALADSALADLAKQRARFEAPRTYQQQYAQAINDYINRGKFTYDFNADPVYNQYKDSYTRQGRLAMKDTMGQAAALTGGYGNSYAQTAGQQVYNNYMQQLNDITPELYRLALDRYNQEGQDMLSKASLLGDADSREYSEIGDAYSRALGELGTYAGLESDERSFGYTREQNELANKLAREQFEYQKQQDAISNSLKARGNGSGTDENAVGLYTFRGVGKTKDKDGNTVDSGFMLFTDPNGKTVKVEKGLSPYTGTKNRDVDNGTFPNGYQPDNIGGEKLTKSGYTDNVNGREQNIWFDPKGYGWIWDGTKNAYQAYTIDGRQATKAMIILYGNHANR